jgi:hypothetical protein
MRRRGGGRERVSNGFSPSAISDAQGCQQVIAGRPGLD